MNGFLQNAVAWPDRINGNLTGVNYCKDADFAALGTEIIELFESGSAEMWVFAGDCQ